jgi:FixJ family two-component response regulator
VSPSLLEPTVFLIDDDAAVRNSLSLLLSTFGMPVQAFESAEEFLRQWNSEAVGCLVMDVRMPGISGFSVQDLLRSRQIPIPIIFITGHGDLNACRRAFQGGAIDFLTKPVDEQALMEGIRKAIQHDVHSRRSFQESRISRERMERLSEREREVLKYIIEGLPNKIIAREIGLSTRTVESHRARILNKLEVESLAALIRTAVMAESAKPG